MPATECRPSMTYRVIVWVSTKRVYITQSIKMALSQVAIKLGESIYYDEEDQQYRIKDTESIPANVSGCTFKQTRNKLPV